MAISRRLRFEILRRDGHTCRYCGGMAPDVKLTVDHVIPVALGGADEPSNLVAACADCNAGKSSVQPGADLVEDVAADAVRWSQALKAAAHNLLADRELTDAVTQRFLDVWNEWTYEYEVTIPPPPIELTGDVLVDRWHAIPGFWADRDSRPVGFADGVLTIQVKRGNLTAVKSCLKSSRARRYLAELLGSEVERIEVAEGWPGPLPSRQQWPTKERRKKYYPLPLGWRDSVERFVALGLPEEELHRFVRVAMTRSIPIDERFRFFCGCCWRAITDLQEDARRFLESERPDAP